jgi:predicted nuclease of predicted toxin-antitoxin system
VRRFYTNENIAVQVVVQLRELGHDVLTSLEAGNANRAVPDAEVLAFAAADRGVLVSHNRRDFVRLHQHRTQPHAGMVLCTFDADFRALARRIDQAVAATSDVADQVIRINRSE